MKEIYNPLLKKEPINAKKFIAQRSSFEAHTALVLYGSRGYLTLRDGVNIGSVTTLLLRGAYNLLYVVDISEHTLQFECQLPLRNPGNCFCATIVLRCMVHTPEVVVRLNITNVGERLEPLFANVLRAHILQFGLEQRAEGEAALNRHITAIFRPQSNGGGVPHTDHFMDHLLRNAAEEMGLRVSSVLISLALEKASENVLSQRSHELDAINHSLELERKQQELAKQRRAFEYGAALEHKDHDVAMITKGNTLDLQQADHENVLLTKKRGTFDEYIKMGKWGLLALHIAQNPKDVGLIVQMIDQQEEMVVNAELEFLRTALQADAVEGHQLNATVREMMGRLSQRIFTMSAHARPLSAPTPAGSDELGPPTPSPEALPEAVRPRIAYPNQWTSKSEVPSALPETTPPPIEGEVLEPLPGELMP